MFVYMNDFVIYRPTGQVAFVVHDENCGGVYRGHVDLWFGDAENQLPVLKQVLASDCDLIPYGSLPLGIGVGEEVS